MILRTSVALCLTVASGSLSSDFKLALTPTVQIWYIQETIQFLYTRKYYCTTQSCMLSLFSQKYLCPHSCELKIARSQSLKLSQHQQCHLFHHRILIMILVSRLVKISGKRYIVFLVIQIRQTFDIHLVSVVKLMQKLITDTALTNSQSFRYMFWIVHDITKGHQSPLTC